MKYTTEQIESEAAYFEEAARAESNLAHSETAAMLRQLLTQRAELLEALKKIAAITKKDVGSDWEEIEEAQEIASKAITNTEATK